MISAPLRFWEVRLVYEVFSGQRTIRVLRMWTHDDELRGNRHSPIQICPFGKLACILLN